MEVETRSATSCRVQTGVQGEKLLCGIHLVTLYQLPKSTAWRVNILSPVPAPEGLLTLHSRFVSQRLEWFIIHGPNLKAILSQHFVVTSWPQRLPPWSFGLWLTASFTIYCDSQTVHAFIKGMGERNIPMHVFQYDPGRMHIYYALLYNWLVVAL